jgi:hypothetical protein
MNRWETFLNSLATRGGNILLLTFFVLFLGVLVVHVLHHPETNADVKTVLLSTFSGFTGALIAALQGGGSRQRNNEQPHNAARGNGLSNVT